MVSDTCHCVGFLISLSNHRASNRLEWRRLRLAYIFVALLNLSKFVFTVALQYKYILWNNTRVSVKYHTMHIYFNSRCCLKWSFKLRKNIERSVASSCTFCEYVPRSEVVEVNNPLPLPSKGKEGSNKLRSTNEVRWYYMNLFSLSFSRCRNVNTDGYRRFPVYSL